MLKKAKYNQNGNIDRINLNCFDYKSARLAIFGGGLYLVWFLPIFTTLKLAFHMYLRDTIKQLHASFSDP